MNEQIRIVVADDHPIVREGLVAILKTQSDFAVVGEAANGRDLIPLAVHLRPNIILLDLEMPELDGVGAIHSIRQQAPDIEFIVFTAFDSDDRIVNAVQAGAKGYLLKGAPREDIFRAIRVISRGGSLLEPLVATKLLQQFRHPPIPALDPLTEREMEVLQLLARGLPNKAIAAQLFITERTVKFYVSAILAKLGATNRTEAVRIAAQRGLVKL